MQLRSARLCLDCEEIHLEQQCPVCASESFAFLTRWIPAQERRSTQRPPPPPPPETPKATGADFRWLKRGVAGLAVVAISRWVWRNREKPAGD